MSLPRLPAASLSFFFVFVTACGEDKGKGVDESLFSDFAQQSGLLMTHFTGATGEYFFPENTSPGGALFDYDGDGDLDIYLLQGTQLDPDSAAMPLFPPPVGQPQGHRLFRNDLVPGGTLKFADVTEEAGVGHRGYGMGAAVADYDNDGDQDLYLTHFGDNVLYRNEGNGRFTDVTEIMAANDPRWSTSATFFDYDGDRDLDLFVANYVNFTLATNRSCSDPTSGRKDYCGPSTYRPVPDRLFRNDGTSFTDVTGAAGLGRAFGPGLGAISADFDSDGRADLYVANDGEANQLWMNRGNGIFEEDALMAGAAFNMHGVAEASMGVTAGDLDGDGDQDLFMTHLNGETNTLYLNHGDASFYDATDEYGLGSVSLSYTGFGSRWFDYDNDGDLDLFVANGAVYYDERRAGDPYPYGQPNQLFRNDGGRFTDVSRMAGPDFALNLVSRGAAFGDIDNDGDLDILVTNNNGPTQLLLNRAADRNHWLQVRLRGDASNRDGAGARVAVIGPGGQLIWRHAHTDGSYLSANDIRVHFGLGDAQTFEGVGVVWPNGQRERWRDIKADSFVELHQGEGEEWQ